MYIIIGAAAFVIGVIVAAFVLSAAIRANNARRRKAKGQPEKKRRKFEYIKLILALVMLTYFVGVFVGVKIAFIDFSQLGVLLAFIGTPTAVAIGFYAWKAKAENIVKIKKDNPEETAGIPVDVNNINP
ncbi:MAG: hypothetical protein LBR85_05155 [Oscillospiraceae bacterium]|jgi:di/tricarboxylate transporter|nr:hypothetical protein [Oscillospiraceae bacterium]